MIIECRGEKSSGFLRNVKVEGDVKIAIVYRDQPIQFIPSYVDDIGTSPQVSLAESGAALRKSLQLVKNSYIKQKSIRGLNALR